MNSWSVRPTLMAIAPLTGAPSRELFFATSAVAVIVLAAAACGPKDRSTQKVTEEVLLPAFDPAGKCDVLALRSSLESVKAALTESLHADAWQSMSIVDNKLNTGTLPGVILQLPSQPWTLFVPLGGDWAVSEAAKSLSAKLHTTALAYTRLVAPDFHAEQVIVWSAGVALRDHFRVNDRVDGKPIAGNPTLPEVFKRTVLENSLHLPDACDSDPQKLITLLKKHPSTRAYAFRFYGTSKRVLPPSM